MKFLFNFAVCLGSFVLFMQLFSTTAKKGPAEDRFFADRQAEASRSYSTQSPATKPAPAPEMIESTPDMLAAAPDMAKAMPEVATARPDVAPAKSETTAAALDGPAATPDAAAFSPDTAATARDMEATPSEMATVTPDVAPAKSEMTSDPLIAGRPKTKWVPKVVTNAKTEEAPKKKRVASKQPRDSYHSVLWLWGF